MKKLVWILLLSLLSSQAVAQTAIEKCEAFSLMAKIIMGARQANKELSAVLEAVKDDDEAMNNLYQEWALEAYRKPRYSVAENRNAAIHDFTNQKMLQCMEIMTSK